MNHAASYAESEQLERRWRTLRLLAYTVFGLFFLVVLAGATVRVLGAGMGCPDWPTCYGQVIPPVSESQLPTDYRIRYAVAGRLAEPFDPFKTWVEYINRLVSVVAGLAVLGLVGYAWRYFRAHARVLVYVTLIPITLVIEALVGWRVVSTYLAEQVITVHMLLTLALTLLAFLVAAQTYRLTAQPLSGDWVGYQALGWVAWVLLLVQIILGAGLRSQVTKLGVAEGLETTIFYIHRSFSWLVLGMWAYFHWRLYREPTKLPLARRASNITTVLLFVQILGGAVMSYFSFTGFWQVLHLFWALLSANTAFMALYFQKYNSYAPSGGPYHLSTA